jgi:ABC-type transport system involved in cytochrome bd biosynthesis fused ATPase/permease subunit
MGACASSDGNDAAARTLKLALLGVSGTGKSTFYKQLRLCHSDGFSKDEITFATTTLFANILFAVRDLRAVLNDKKIKIGKASLRVSCFLDLSSYSGTHRKNRLLAANNFC